ncbi:MAG: 1-acyl-sn-glycerol-3-phosphate acyltransferase [Bacteroidetes bacterium]|nr:1-acyl-sn-glycerol-3-phosphate acyltransferase [Bacteroidota bacterium]
MLYWILKPLQNIFLRIFYRIDYKGIENIPRGVPVVIATNHANAFIDPCIVGMLPIQKVRFFARGDVFKGKFAKMALESMNISPMYRMQEGYSEIKKNDKTFEECRRLLADNKALLLYPEAICILERRLRPLKKGLSRIVFQSAEAMDYSKNIWIVPAGINYTAANKFGSKVFIEFGKAMSADVYYERFKQDKVKTINEFTRDLERKMSDHLVIVKNPEHDRFLELIEEMYLTEWLKNKNVDPSDLEQQYIGSKEMAAMINHVDEHAPAMLIDLKVKAVDYNRRVKANLLRDHLLHPGNINKMNFGRFLLDGILLWLGLPIYMFGVLTNKLPYMLAQNVADNKVKHIEFYASVHANLGMILWLLYYPAQLLLIAFLFKSWMLLGVLSVLIPLSGLIALSFYPLMKKIFGRLRLLRMVRKDRKIVETLIGDRNEVQHDLKAMIDYYRASQK